MYLGKIVELRDKKEIFSNLCTLILKLCCPIYLSLILERKQREVELSGEIASAIDIPSGFRFYMWCKSPSKECLKTEPELLKVSPSHHVACLREK